MTATELPSSQFENQADFSGPRPESPVYKADQAPAVEPYQFKPLEEGGYASPLRKQAETKPVQFETFEPVKDQVTEIQDFLHSLDIGTEARPTKTGYKLSLYNGTSPVIEGDERNMVYQKALEHGLDPKAAILEYNQLQEKLSSVSAEYPDAVQQVHELLPARPELAKATKEMKPSLDQLLPEGPRSILETPRPKQPELPGAYETAKGFLKGFRKWAVETVNKYIPKAEKKNAVLAKVEDRLGQGRQEAMSELDSMQRRLDAEVANRNRELIQLLELDSIQTYEQEGLRVARTVERAAPKSQAEARYDAWNTIQRREMLQSIVAKLEVHGSRTEDALHAIQIQLESNRNRRIRIQELMVDLLTAQMQDYKRNIRNPQIWDSEGQAIRKLDLQVEQLSAEGRRLEKMRDALRDRLAKLDELYTEATTSQAAIEGMTKDPFRNSQQPAVAVEPNLIDKQAA